MSEYTDEQIVEAISKAIAARDFPAVVGLLKVLALQAPDKAQTIYDLIMHRKITLEVPR